jgi:hypothetical protein
MTRAVRASVVCTAVLACATPQIGAYKSTAVWKVFEHADPVVGPVRVLDGGRCLADDNGCRTLVGAHMGNLAARWMDGRRDEVLQDLDDAASAGYHWIRSWWHLGRPTIFDPTLDYRDPDFVQKGIELANAVAVRGLRVSIGSGGIARLNSEQEREMARAFRAIIDGASAWKFIWAEPVNEPSSIHATSDDDGDNSPANLRVLSRIMTDGTGLLWHLGYATNVGWSDSNNRFSQKNYTSVDQAVGYIHGHRGGHVWDKIRHRFSWLYETPGEEVRLWIEGEGVGAPVCNNSLHCVSATANGHELDSAEAQSLIVAMQSLRGAGTHMSGNGVQRYQGYSETIGWREIPWMVAQLPRDVHTFRTIHHSGPTWRHIRVLAAQGEVRVDGVVGDDGRFAYVVYGPGGSYRLRADRGFSGRLCNPTSMTCDVVSVTAGGEMPVSFTFGRLLVGRVE